MPRSSRGCLKYGSGVISFSLSQQIPGGKNQIGISTRHGKVMRFPNRRFVLWRKEAALEVLTQVKVSEKPLKGSLAMTVQYVPQDQRTRDIPGMTDALCHLLEFCGLIEDDGQIQSLYWARALAGYTTIQLRAL